MTNLNCTYLSVYDIQFYFIFQLINENKNIFKAANTPITLTTVAMIFYVASQILGLIGLYPFANVLNLAMMFTFSLLMMWSYCRYTGNLSEIGATIDSMSETGK